MARNTHNTLGYVIIIVLVVVVVHTELQSYQTRFFVFVFLKALWNSKEGV